jgi:hypothetical protein
MNEKTLESPLAMSVFDYHMILKASPEMKWNFKTNCMAFPFSAKTKQELYNVLVCVLYTPLYYFMVVSCLFQKKKKLGIAYEDRTIRCNTTIGRR